MDAAASTATAQVAGRRTPSRDSRRRSRVPAWWSMTPVTMNRLDLNSAWASSMTAPASAAVLVPAPSRAISMPSSLMVLQASSFFRSFSRSARQAPSTIVVSPAVRTSRRQGPTSAKPGASRATR